jgi:glycosyltransferase involved in cell wall biosynthesis
MHPNGSALLLAAHPPGSGTGSGIRNQVVLHALRSSFASVDVVALASPGEADLSIPDATLIPRPAGLSRWRVARSLTNGGIYFAPQRELDLTERLRALAAGGSLRREYDLVWAHQSVMAKPGLEGVTARTRVLDVDTVVARVMRSAAEPTEQGDRAATVKRAYARLHAAAAGREERRAWAHFRHLVVASGSEVGRLGPLAGKATVIPNAVPAPDPVEAASASDLLFTGSLDYRPNVRAAETLVTSVLPLIRSQCPTATLTVAGRNPTADVRQICSAKRVSLVANAPSLSPLYRGARVFAAMLPFGGGTKVKVIEAMAHGIPIVANPVAAEGLALVDGQNALIRDTDEAFAAGCVELLRDPSLAKRIGLAGLDTWSEHYRPESVEASIKALLETARPPV